MPSTTNEGSENVQGPHPLGRIPDDLIRSICREVAYHIAVGGHELGGEDFDRIFASAVGANRVKSRNSLADATLQNCCWSLKTVLHKVPDTLQCRIDSPPIRLISGRMSPYYSVGISDPTVDTQRTGTAVLKTYNKRINGLVQQYGDVRLVVLLRNLRDCKFAIFERRLSTIDTDSYSWKQNDRNNLEAYCGKEHAFTWQPSGGQFTVLEPVPPDITIFQFRQRPAQVEAQQILAEVGYSDAWINISRAP